MKSMNIKTKLPLYPFQSTQRRFKAFQWLFVCMLTICLLFSLPASHLETAFAQPGNTVAVAIRYIGSDANEVFLVWKIVNSKDMSEVIQPAGTVVKNGSLQTPMVKEGDNFVIQLDLPTWQTLTYSFLKTKDQNGNPINILDNNHGSNYQTDVTDQDNAIEISPMGQVQVTAIPNLPVGTLVNQDILYHASEAGEVQLVWGVDGWNPLPEGIRPDGTVINKGVMNTPMTKLDSTFKVTLRVPVGSKIQYGFYITKLQDGTEIKPVWDDRSQDEIVVKRGGTKDIEANLMLQGKGLRNFNELSLVDQEIRYRAERAGEVYLVWGIDGWNPVPLKVRPAGTVVKDEIMYTPMKQAGGVFSVILKLPAETKIDFDFQIVRAVSGQTIEVWDLNGDPKQDYHAVVGDGKAVDIDAPEAIVKQIPENHFILYGGIVLSAGLVVLFIIWIISRRKKRKSMIVEQRAV